MADAQQTPVPEHRSAPLIWRLVRYSVRPHLGTLIAAALMMGVVAGTTAALAWLLEPAVDQIFVARDARMLYLVPLAIILVNVVKALADYGQSVLMNRVGHRIVSDTQVQMFDHLMRADLAWLNAVNSARLQSSFLYDVVLLREAVSKAITGAARDLISVVALAGVMIVQNWRLAIIGLVIVPFAGQAMRRLGKRMRKASTAAQEETGTLTVLIDERLAAARLVKIHGMETAETTRVAGAIDRRMAHIMKTVATRAAASPVTDVLGGLAIAGVILYAGLEAQAGNMTLGALSSFLAAMLMAYQPLKSLANMNTAMQEGLAAAVRIFAILDVEPTIRDRADAPALRIAKGEIRFEGVRFHYGDGTSALDGVDITVPSGARVALVGPSGAGKTTCLNLIPRFHDPSAGRVLIDGQDIAAVSLASLRAGIGLVTQETLLFDDSVAANIAYGLPNATRADIEQAARDAAAHDFIMRLPDGYDTLVGEAGVRLSGGQRQRLAIARAMLRDPPILLLDEATSALDPESERQVQAALTRLSTGRTTVIVAHRLSSVVDADRIYVLDRGRVVDSGSHPELVARGGLYASLYAETRLVEAVDG
ncbi:ABC transporter ATP-binding protein [Zavarzinia sp. CC-PAN008]|uniref:ABC transporter ATP-binding protein n=1 Tax=Zavarzinia sp. CC-PAN008 TaxID=3243332 RepID=UPI003F74AC64